MFRLLFKCNCEGVHSVLKILVFKANPQPADETLRLVRRPGGTLPKAILRCPEQVRQINGKCFIFKTNSYFTLNSLRQNVTSESTPT